MTATSVDISFFSGMTETVDYTPKVGDTVSVTVLVNRLGTVKDQEDLVSTANATVESVDIPAVNPDGDTMVFDLKTWNILGYIPASGGKTVIMLEHREPIRKRPIEN